jgi:hypothetical protein
MKQIDREPSWPSNIVQNYREYTDRILTKTELINSNCGLPVRIEKNNGQLIGVH